MNVVQLGNAASIVVDVDKTTYWPGQVAMVSTNVTDDKGCPINARVTIDAIYHDSNRDIEVYKQTILTKSAYLSNFGIGGLIRTGDYNVTASTIINGKEEKSWNTFRVVNLYQSPPGYLLFIALFSFSALVIITSIRKIRMRLASEILRFAFISFFVLSTIGTFIFVNEDFGRGSPVGLVRKPAIDGQWVINIGGNMDYTTGVQVPVYVFIFGIAGGYLRYLYNTSKIRTNVQTPDGICLFNWNDVPGKDSDRLRFFLKHKLKLNWITDGEFENRGNTISIRVPPRISSANLTSESKPHILSIIREGGGARTLADNKMVYRFTLKNEDGSLNVYPETFGQRWLFYQSLEDIALLLLSPLLAIAVWLLLVQGGVQDQTGTPMLAVISFTTGLVTDDVIQSLIRFVSSKLRNY